MSVPVTDARAAHAEGVERLLASYRAVPAAAPVRLAKRTSNLFRSRAATGAAGLDTSGLTGVIAIDAEKKTIDLRVAPDELERRRRAWRAPARELRGLLAKYARLVSPASLGAFTE